MDIDFKEYVKSHRKLCVAAGSALVALIAYFIVTSIVGNSYFKQGMKDFEAGRYKSAIENFESATSWRHTEGKFWLAKILYNPYYTDTLTVDYNRVVELFNDCLDNDIKEANYHLGVMYLNGHGIKADAVLAMQYFGKDAGKESAASRYELYKYLLKAGKTDSAIEYLKKAAENGHREAAACYAQYLIGSNKQAKEGISKLKSNATAGLAIANYYMYHDCIWKGELLNANGADSKEQNMMGYLKQAAKGRTDIKERLLESSHMLSVEELVGMKGQSEAAQKKTLFGKGFEEVKKDGQSSDFCKGMGGDTIYVNLMKGGLEGNVRMRLRTYSSTTSGIFYRWLLDAYNAGFKLERLGYGYDNLALMSKDSCCIVFDSKTRSMRTWFTAADKLTEEDILQHLASADTALVVLQKKDKFLYTTRKDSRKIKIHNLYTGLCNSPYKPFEMLGMNDTIIFGRTEGYVSRLFTPKNIFLETDKHTILIETEKNVYCKNGDRDLVVYNVQPWSERDMPDHRVIAQSGSIIALRHNSNNKFALLNTASNSLTEKPQLTVMGIDGTTIASKDNANQFVQYDIESNTQTKGKKIFGNADNYFVCVGEAVEEENGFRSKKKVIETYSLSGNRRSISYPETGDDEWFPLNIQSMKFVDGKVLIIYRTEYGYGVEWDFAIYNPASDSYNHLTDGKTCKSIKFVGNNVQIEYEGTESDDGKFNTICPVITYDSDGDEVARSSKTYKDTFHSNWRKVYPVDEFGDKHYDSPYLEYRSSKFRVQVGLRSLTISFGYTLQSVVSGVALKDQYGNRTALHFLHSDVFDEDNNLDIIDGSDIEKIIDALDAGEGAFAVSYEGFFLDSTDQIPIGPETRGLKEAIRRLVWEYDHM